MPHLRCSLAILMGARNPLNKGPLGRKERRQAGPREEDRLTIQIGRLDGKSPDSARPPG